MLNEGNGKGTTALVYERDRLRSRARKLGLRLVKTLARSPEEAQHPAPIVQKARMIVAQPGKTPEAETEFDKCG